MAQEIFDKTCWSSANANRKNWLWMAFLGAILGFAIVSDSSWASEAASGDAYEFPLSLESYGDDKLVSVGAMIRHRIVHELFNLVAEIIFFCAIIHTFMASKLMSISHRRRHAHA